MDGMRLVRGESSPVRSTVGEGRVWNVSRTVATGTAERVRRRRDRLRRTMRGSWRQGGATGARVSFARARRWGERRSSREDVWCFSRAASGVRLLLVSLREPVREKDRLERGVGRTVRERALWCDCRGFRRLRGLCREVGLRLRCLLGGVSRRDLCELCVRLRLLLGALAVVRCDVELLLLLLLLLLG